jgi:hypothetical protein
MQGHDVYEAPDKRIWGGCGRWRAIDLKSSLNLNKLSESLFTSQHKPHQCTFLQITQQPPRILSYKLNI